MAKKAKRTGTPKHGFKSAAIREYLAANQDAKPKQIIEDLKAKGIDVSPNMVSVVKAKSHIKSASRQAKQAVTNKDATAAAQTSKSAGLDAVLVLYKAARGQSVPQSSVTSAFLSLVEMLS